jgi:hypothetical protein
MITCLYLEHNEVYRTAHISVNLYLENTWTILWNWKQIPALNKFDKMETDDEM